jgi:hydroxyacylglutathione hydrolase
LKVILTPGHSPGSLSFYCKKDGFVISGDALFYRSIGRTDLPMGHHETLIESIRNNLFTLPDETIVYSGHGKPTTIGDEKSHNPFLQ